MKMNATLERPIYLPRYKGHMYVRSLTSVQQQQPQKVARARNVMEARSNY